MQRGTVPIAMAIDHSHTRGHMQMIDTSPSAKKMPSLLFVKKMFHRMYGRIRVRNKPKICAVLRMKKKREN